MIPSLRKFDTSEVAQKRMAIIKFYESYGEAATKEAFGADRKVVGRWRRRLTGSGGRLAALVPSSTRPHHLRTAVYNPAIVDYIKTQRESHHRLGKAKLKPLLDQYCEQNGLPTVSESTIGNIVKRRQFFFQKDIRIYHDPNRHEAKRAKRTRVKHSPKHPDSGHIISDAITILVDGMKRYFICAIDTQTKFALSLPYSRLTSKNNADFFQRFVSVYPGTIKDWQTDNGAENQGKSGELLKARHIPHLFSYPRCPKINSYIERYNRTVQDEFIYPNLHLIHDSSLFGTKLAEYLVWYNAKRPHQTLGQISPINFLLQKGGMSHKYLTYTLNCAVLLPNI